jgi:hypothetical protein
LVAADICYGTVSWQWLIRVYLVQRIWVLSKRWLAMDVCSASDIPDFSTPQYITLDHIIPHIFQIIAQ